MSSSSGNNNFCLLVLVRGVLFFAQSSRLDKSCVSPNNNFQFFRIKLTYTASFMLIMLQFIDIKGSVSCASHSRCRT